MGLILNQIEIRGTIKTVRINALIDSGGEDNYTSEILPDGLRPDQLEFISYNEIPVSIPGSSSSELHQAFTFNSITLHRHVISESEFIVLDNIDFPVIIGVELLQMLGINMDSLTDTIRI
ncbi:MAG: hypothetical protein ACYDAO_00110 [Thermoplasmataceae archaeon]